MLFKLDPTNFRHITEFESAEFSSIACGVDSFAKESHLEELIADNVSLIESTLDEEDSATLLMIGRQIQTVTGRRMDLVAIDSSGKLMIRRRSDTASDTTSRRMWTALYDRCFTTVIECQSDAICLRQFTYA